MNDLYIHNPDEGKVNKKEIEQKIKEGKLNKEFKGNKAENIKTTQDDFINFEELVLFLKKYIFSSFNFLYEIDIKSLIGTFSNDKLV